MPARQGTARHGTACVVSLIALITGATSSARAHDCPFFEAFALPLQDGVRVIQDRGAGFQLITRGMSDDGLLVGGSGYAFLPDGADLGSRGVVWAIDWIHPPVSTLEVLSGPPDPLQDEGSRVFGVSDEGDRVGYWNEGTTTFGERWTTRWLADGTREFLLDEFEATSIGIAREVRRFVVGGTTHVRVVGSSRRSDAFGGTYRAPAMWTLPLGAAIPSELVPTYLGGDGAIGEVFEITATEFAVGYDRTRQGDGSSFDRAAVWDTTTPSAAPVLLDATDDVRAWAFDVANGDGPIGEQRIVGQVLAGASGAGVGVPGQPVRWDWDAGAATWVRTRWHAPGGGEFDDDTAARGVAVDGTAILVADPPGLTEERSWIASGDRVEALDRITIAWDFVGDDTLVRAEDISDDATRLVVVAGNETVLALARSMRVCPADIDNDAGVGFSDLTLVLASWGPDPLRCAADIDGDGQAGFGDLLIVLSGWGPCGESGAAPVPPGVLDCLAATSDPERLLACIEALVAVQGAGGGE